VWKKYHLEYLWNICDNTRVWKKYHFFQTLLYCHRYSRCHFFQTLLKATYYAAKNTIWNICSNTGNLLQQHNLENIPSGISVTTQKYYAAVTGFMCCHRYSRWYFFQTLLKATYYAAVTSVPTQETCYSSII
jgi:hypothetical protein